jgi:transposase
MLQLNQEERAAVRQMMRRAPQAHLRMKATAIWNLSRGKSRREVADFLGVSKTSISVWCTRFREEGPAGLAIRPGRGRPPRADLGEVERYLRQSPRTFGLPQTRWTLRALATVVPSLQGFSEMGVWKVLQRMGFRYKRGQPHLTSPDPAYEEKRAAWSKRFEKPALLLAR